MNDSHAVSRNIPRSIGAVLAGFVALALSSIPCTWAGAALHINYGT